MKCKDITRHIEEYCPKKLAEEWDNVGFLVGDPNQEVKRVLVALDATEEVINEAIEKKADLIVTHHPLIFKPIKKVTADSADSKLVYKLIRNNISLFSAHTNLDTATGGINDVLAELIGLTDTKPLDIAGHKKLKKLVVFVPETHTEAVREAMSRAGAGHIGKYSDCSFMIGGVGTFRPLNGADPYIGEVGELEKVKEYRIDTILEESIQNKVIKAMLDAHPYEEVAYDIYPLENKGEAFGLGRVGMLDKEYTLEEYAQLVKKSLNIANVRVVGNLTEKVKKAAICSGSGMSLLDKAAASGADVFVNGDVKYSNALEAIAKGINVIDAGHYETENIIVPVLKRYLEKLNGIEVIESKINGNPFKAV